MKIVVTGATGMIGIHLITKFVENGHYVYAVAHKNSNRIDRIPKNKNVEIIECNLDELLNLPKMINSTINCFYHLAWAGTFGDSRNELYSQVDNIKYSLDAVNSAHLLGCEVFIGAGSQAEFGRTDLKLNEKIPCFPENGYGIAKLSAGYLTRLECEKYGMKHIWTRILSIYGPFDGEKTLISYVIKNMLEKKEINVSKSEQIWDYMFVKDCSEALYLLAEKGVCGKTYCIGSGIDHPLKHYIEKIKELIDDKSIINYGGKNYSPKQVMHLVADISDLKNDTGFELKYTFEKGINETIEYWKGNLKDE